MNRFYLLVFISILLSCTSKMDLQKPPETVPPSPEADYLWVIKPTVNLREDNQKHTTRVAALNDGDSVLVIKNQDGWYLVRTADNVEGWIRSDLLGPRQLSVYPKAIVFADQLQTEEQTVLFFDSKLHHRRIFISFPKGYYTSNDTIMHYANQLIVRYQNEVYSGPVTALVLKPGSEDIYKTLNKRGKINADLKLPVAPLGRIKDADFSDPRRVSLIYVVKENIRDDRFIEVARKMAGVYPLSYREIEILFVDPKDNCVFWYHEDKNGEHYQFSTCP